MQKKATQSLHMSGEKIMKLAEELYQAGFISYPRTETDSFPASMDLMVPHPALCMHAVIPRIASAVLYTACCTCSSISFALGGMLGMLLMLLCETLDYLALSNLTCHSSAHMSWSYLMYYRQQHTC